MKKCALYAAALFAAFSSASPAVAGPDRTTEALMNEYVSLLDWGIHLLNEQLRPEGGSNESVFVSYDWDQNKLFVHNRAYTAKPTKETAEKECELWIEEMRVRAGINLDSGKAYDPHSYWGYLFKHSGFVKGSAEEMNDRIADLDKKFELSFFRFLDSEKFFSCEAPLLGTSYSISVE